MTRAPSSGLCRPTRARSWFQDKLFDGDTPVAFKYAKGWSCDNIFLESSGFPFSRHQLAEGGEVEVVMTKLTHLGPFEPRVRRMSPDIPLAQSNQRTRRTRTGVPLMLNAVIVEPRYGQPRHSRTRLRLT